MSSAAFQSFHQQSIERINVQLESLFASLNAPATLKEAMHYAVMNGGKRLRPALAYAACTAILREPLSSNNPKIAAADAAAVALELIHAYSLVHDDLPAMDDDDLRRGKPSCHIAYGEASAILVGDALQTLAFEHLGRSTGLSDRESRRLGIALATASGANGMVSGQLQDLEAVQSSAIGLPELETLHRAKTGALICAALEMGAICADAEPDCIAALGRYGQSLGLAFQVIDDVLDVTGSTEELGKQQGSDELLGKPTYPSLMGLSAAEAHGLQLCEQAKHALNQLPIEHEVLFGLADFVVQRRH